MRAPSRRNAGRNAAKESYCHGRVEIGKHTFGIVAMRESHGQLVAIGDDDYREKLTLFPLDPGVPLGDTTIDHLCEQPRRKPPFFTAQNG
jgi:hypothetical protein